ncbi:unnamed protein product, partial [Bubo scandiacus]
MPKLADRAYGALLATSLGKRLGMKFAWRTCKVQSPCSPQCVMAVNTTSFSEQLLSSSTKSKARGGSWLASAKGGKICPLCTATTSEGRKGEET